jgi:hypothetical protein
MTYGTPQASDDPRQTMCQNYTEDGTPCGSGSSDCPNWEVIREEDSGLPMVRLTSSHDVDRTGAFLDFRPHEWGQVFDKVRNGQLPEFLVQAIKEDEAICAARAEELKHLHDNHRPEFGTREAQEYAELTGVLLVPVTGPMPVPTK